MERGSFLDGRALTYPGNTLHDGNRMTDLGFVAFRAAQPALSEQAARDIWDKHKENVRRHWTRIAKAVFAAGLSSENEND